jgi:hypothetical protein
MRSFHNVAQSQPFIMVAQQEEKDASWHLPQPRSSQFSAFVTPIKLRSTGVACVDQVAAIVAALPLNVS